MRELKERRIPGPRSAELLEMARACEPPCSLDQVPVV